MIQTHFPTCTVELSTTLNPSFGCQGERKTLDSSGTLERDNGALRGVCGPGLCTRYILIHAELDPRASRFHLNFRVKVFHFHNMVTVLICHAHLPLLYVLKGNFCSWHKACLWNGWECFSYRKLLSAPQRGSLEKGILASVPSLPLLLSLPLQGLSLFLLPGDTSPKSSANKTFT